MRLQKLKITTRFKNLEKFEIDFSTKEGITVLIGNNGSGKSNILEAISSIYAGLYNSKHNPTFNYELTYSKDTYYVEIEFKNKVYSVKINGKEDNLKPEHLPSQVISSYSGEESRLWDNYYWPFYEDYIKAIRGASIPNSNLIYINKYYWNIALLTLHFYDFNVFTDIRDFCQKTLEINSLDQIEFTFNIAKLNDFLKNPNPVTNFVTTLNPNKDEVLKIDLETFKARLNNLTEIEVFRYLSASFMPKADKLITNIQITYNSKLDTECLSEGEKKLLLIMLILEVIGDENSLILLDEPDSHIHLSRKEEIQKLLSKYSNRENIITTHSPTLTHAFDLKHITMLTKKPNNDAQIESKAKQEIVHELTKGIWSYQEQNIFLNSKKDILLVEGKYDKIYISEALKRLQPKIKKYQKLDFEYLPMGGADGLENFVNKFTAKKGQKIIALLDRDSDGKKPIEKVLGKNIDLTFDYEKKKDTFFVLYPKLKNWRTSNFIVEDYFKKSTIRKQALDLIDKADDTFKMFPNDVKGKVKERLPILCVKPEFHDNEFNGFKVLFDKLLEIKSQV